MIKLQCKDYVTGEWMTVSEWANERIAWVSLGLDNWNYRTVDEKGNVLTDKSNEPFEIDKMSKTEVEEEDSNM